jgi:hypothetical protein
MTGERDRARERLVRVAVAENETTARLIHDELLRAGIRSLVKNADPTSAVYGGVAAPWALEVYVLEGDVAAATTLLGGARAPEPLPPPALGAAPRRRPWWRRLFGPGKQRPGDGE